MKLLMCNNCYDVFSLKLNVTKNCSCGQTEGKYVTDLNAEYSGNATLIGFRNNTLIKAVNNPGIDFIAFTIKEDSPTFKKK